jgi:Tfp pilus assembly PilM family ATPase
MNLFFNKKIPLAIDISRDRIRVIQSGKNKQIIFSASIPTPEGAFVNNRITNTHVVADIIKKTLKEIHPTPREVVFGIPDTQCFSKVFTFDKKENVSTQ